MKTLILLATAGSQQFKDCENVLKDLYNRTINEFHLNMELCHIQVSETTWWRISGWIVRRITTS